MRPDTSIVATRGSVMSCRKFPGGSGDAMSARSADRARPKSIIENLASSLCAVQDRRDDLFRVEMGLRQLACSPTMALVIAIDRVEGLGGLQRRVEPEHPLAAGQEGAGAGVLHHDRLAACQVTE